MNKTYNTYAPLYPYYITVFAIISKVKTVAERFYGIKLEMKMEKQEVLFDTVVTIFNIKFENTVYTDAQAAAAKLREAAMPVRASILFDMFPFCILFQVGSLIYVPNQ